MDLFKFEEEKNARLEYNTMLGEGVPEVLAGQNLADKYGKELAEKVIKELRGWINGVRYLRKNRKAMLRQKRR